MNDLDFIQAIGEVDWLAKSDHISSVLNAAYQWEWLPTSREQNNPFPIDIPEEGKELVNELALKSYKATLISLRKVGSKNILLQDSPHDYTDPFKGAALYCLRHAAKEFATGQKGKWTEILEIFKKGRWPCGIQESGKLVVM